MDVATLVIVGFVFVLFALICLTRCFMIVLCSHTVTSSGLYRSVHRVCCIYDYYADTDLERFVDHNDNDSNSDTDSEQEVEVKPEVLGIVGSEDSEDCAMDNRIMDTSGRVRHSSAVKCDRFRREFSNDKKRNHIKDGIHTETNGEMVVTHNRRATMDNDNGVNGGNGNGNWKSEITNTEKVESENVEESIL